VAEVTIDLDPAVIAGLARNTDVQAVMDMLAGRVTGAMKARCPVSPYGSGENPSGYLRSSCRAFAEPDGSRIVGPTADYGGYVNDGTDPHIIRAHGDYSLHNAHTGQYFGPVVHHPGTKPTHFVEDSLSAIAGAIVEV
jgi:hypothetical protein